MNDLISVIIPVYNVKEYLTNCVESIEAQTYKSFEIILVDDGSSDGSEKLCDELGKAYSNITVVHQKNAGASAARNNGIAHAKGRYTVFCDSDDFIDSTMLEKLINTKKLYPEHLPVCGIRKISAEKEKDYLIKGEKFLTLDKSDFFIIQEAQLFNAPVNKLFDKEIIDSFSIRFNPDIVLGEDMAFNADYVMKANCDFAVINEPLYFYNIFVNESLSKRYIPDILDNYIALDRKFRELIEFTGADMNKYEGRLATINLFSIVNSIKNTMSEKNPAARQEKIKQIKKILGSFDVKDIVSKADTNAYSDIYIKMLCTGNANLIYTFRTLKK